MAHNPRIIQQARHISLIKRRHFMDIKPRKGSAEILALLQNGPPRQTRLEPLETDFLEQPHIIGDGIAPFLVMVAHILGMRRTPCATGLPVLAHKHIHHFCSCVFS